MNEVKFKEERQKLESLKREVLDGILEFKLPAEYKIRIADVKSLTHKLSQENKLRIVLCGRYSVGKSTLASILTGREIPTGDGVTTQTAIEYECDDWIVVDTPGIRADHPEHDEITLKWMERANLLIYMCTIQGIGAEEKKDFDQLILDRYRGKSMLVMNQLSKEDPENEPQWRSDIERVVGGKEKLSDMYFTIMDARRYLRANGNESLIASSRFGEFLQNFNSFVREKNLMAGLVPQIDVLRGLLEHIREHAASKVERNEYVRRQLKAVDEAIDSLYLLLDETERDAIAKIDNIEKEMLLLVNKDNLKDLQLRCKSVEGELSGIFKFETLENGIRKVIRELDEEVKDAYHKAGKFSAGTSVSGVNGPNINQINIDLLKSVCDKLSKMLSSLTKGGLIKLVHMFGGKFKPWGATKWLKFLNNLGPILQAAALAADGVVNAILEKKLEAFRIQVSDDFETTKREVRKIFGGERNKADGLIGQLRNLREEISLPDKERMKNNDEKTRLSYWVDDKMKRLALLASEI